MSTTGGSKMSAASDVKLVPGQVVVDAWDFCLDSPDRRKDQANPTAPASNRRALVHDFNDGLTMNWGQDYPGGVTINGVVNVPTRLEVGDALEVTGAFRIGENRLTANETTLFGKVRVEGELQAAKLLVAFTSTIVGPQRVPIPVTIPIDVGSELATLKQKVAKLEKKIANM
jgi:hypothetical protein